MKDYLHFPGKITYKRKAPEEPIAHVIRRKQYREQAVKKNEKRKGKKKEWTCVYCGIEFSTDNRSKTVRKWINCDNCVREMHLSCVPKKHLRLIDFSMDDFEDDEEIDFLCEFCFTQDSD